MNCQDYQLHIALQSYGELDGVERAALAKHLHECADCEAVSVEQRELDRLLAEHSDDALPADLLLESRRALAVALGQVETKTKRSWWRIPTFAVEFTPMKLLESAALVAMGLALGFYVGHQGSGTSLPSSASDLSSIPSNGTLNLRIVKADASGMVELAGQVVQPFRRQGNIKDREVRQLLFGALQDVSNPGARLNALEVLARQPSDLGIQEGLIHALTHDPVPGVRMKALDSLKASAGLEEVQRALVQVLKNDDVPGIRAGAIEALMGVSQTADVARTIEEVAKEDENSYVRMVGETHGLRYVGSEK